MRPLFAFEANEGQFPSAVHFVRRTTASPGSQVHIARDTMVLGNNIRIQIADVPPNVVPKGESPTAATYNFYLGNNPSSWRTNARLFDAVRLPEIYPGVSAAFRQTVQSVGSITGVGRGAVVVSLQPGADLRRFRLRVLNTGATPFEGPGGVWYTGGRIPGVFTVAVQGVQIQGNNRVPLTSGLVIESPEVLSLRADGWAAGTSAEFTITFPDFTIFNASPPAAASDGNRYYAATTSAPRDFGAEGSVSGPQCESTCADAILARLDERGDPLWVTVMGGERGEESVGWRASNGGLSVFGSTTSRDFPVTGNAPHRSPGSARDVFLGFVDKSSGVLRNATYAGLERRAWPQASAVDTADEQVAVGGAYSDDIAAIGGFVLRWSPAQNRLVFQRSLDSPVQSMIFDSGSILHFVAAAPVGSHFTATAIDGTGRQYGTPVTVPVTVPGTRAAGDFRLVPEGGDLWIVYQVYGDAFSARTPVAIARTSPTTGRLLLNQTVVNQGAVSDIALTTSGNLKVLLRFVGSTETTTADAPLTAACSDTDYLAFLSPTGRLVHATYVPSQGFDFAGAREPQNPPAARIGCIANSAGRLPAISAAPGQLITITGGGFGPNDPVFTAPDKGGNYPMETGGFRVRIGNIDAPIVALARGLIAVQVPFEISLNDAMAVEVFDGGTALNAIRLTPASFQVDLFNTGERGNALNLPALAALNQDGTVNSAANPAPAGSIVSVFGTGLGRLSIPLDTGGVSPLSPLGTTSLLPACSQCEVTYLGSAPGLSTSVFQANVRILLPGGQPDAETRPQAIGLGMYSSGTRPPLFISPSGVVFVK